MPPIHFYARIKTTDKVLMLEVLIEMNRWKCLCMVIDYYDHYETDFEQILLKQKLKKHNRIRQMQPVIGVGQTVKLKPLNASTTIQFEYETYPNNAVEILAEHAACNIFDLNSGRMN